MFPSCPTTTVMIGCDKIKKLEDKKCCAMCTYVLCTYMYIVHCTSMWNEFIQVLLYFCNPIYAENKNEQLSLYASYFFNEL